MNAVNVINELNELSFEAQGRGDVEEWKRRPQWSIDRLYGSTYEAALAIVDRTPQDVLYDSGCTPVYLDREEEAAHMTLIVLAEYIYSQRAGLHTESNPPQEGFYTNFPSSFGTEPDRTGHFFMHAFCSFESLYVNKYRAMGLGTPFDEYGRAYASYTSLTGLGPWKIARARFAKRYRSHLDDSPIERETLASIANELGELSPEEWDALQLAFWHGVDIEVGFGLMQGMDWEESLQDTTVDMMGGYAGIYVFRNPAQGTLPHWEGK